MAMGVIEKDVGHSISSQGTCSLGHVFVCM